MTTKAIKKGCPFELLLFLLVPALIVGAIMLALRAVQEGPADEVNHGIVAIYLGLIADEHYDEAYDQCLTAEYRSRMTREEFAEAHRRTRAERGALLDREILRIQQGRNLFSGVQDLQLQYRLTYEQGEWRNYIATNTSGGDWLINGTYRRAAKYLEPEAL